MGETGTVVAFSVTVMLLEARLLVMRSRRPSPFRSPADMATGAFPVGSDSKLVNVPLPRLRKTETVLSPSLAVTRSGAWSPLKSAAITATGPFPVLRSVREVKPPFPSPRNTGKRVVGLIGDSHVRLLSVTIEISNGDCGGPVAGSDVGPLEEGAIARALEDRDAP